MMPILSCVNRRQSRMRAPRPGTLELRNLPGPNDMDRLGLEEGEMVGLEPATNDGVRREVKGLRVTRYDIPEGCCASFYPECNPLIPLWRHADRSHVRRRPSLCAS